MLFGVSGVLNLVYGPVPGSASTLLTPGWRALWLGILLFGCVCTLYGALSRRMTGFYWEYVGLSSMGLSIILYGINIFLMLYKMNVPFGPQWFGSLLVAGLGGFLLWKWWQVAQAIKQLSGIP